MQVASGHLAGTGRQIYDVNKEPRLTGPGETMFVAGLDPAQENVLSVAGGTPNIRTRLRWSSWRGRRREVLVPLACLRNSHPQTSRLVLTRCAAFCCTIVDSALPSFVSLDVAQIVRPPSFSWTGLDSSHLLPLLYPPFGFNPNLLRGKLLMTRHLCFVTDQKSTFSLH